MDVLLGLDLGTTNIKVLVVGSHGQPIALASAPTPEVNGEYDAEALWGVSARLIRKSAKNPGWNTASLDTMWRIERIARCVQR